MSRNIVLFDPSYGTRNQGDLIINEAIMRELNDLLSPNYLVRYSTHTPVLHGHQMLFKTSVRALCETADLKFLGGTNLIKTNLLGRKPGWNVNILTAPLYSGAISIGCGVGGEGGLRNGYTRHLYRRMLSGRFVHSVRDHRTVELLDSIGIRAVNTGCPTMWGLTQEHCAAIPQGRSRSVIFTLTDYSRNARLDTAIVSLLKDSYEKVYVWLQGSRDYEYLVDLGLLDQVEIIAPTVDAYRSILQAGDVDYIGTRLHAGIFAMQHKRRALILAVDHRALDIRETHTINVVGREDFTSLREVIDGPLVTQVKLDLEGISAWKKQFEAYGTLAQTRD